MRTRTSSAVVLSLAGILLTACGHDVHASPPGVADHQPGNTRNAPASQPGGTCGLLSSAAIQGAFGRQVSAGTADNLTPGLDRCNWTITHSALCTQPLELTAYRPLNASSTPASSHQHGATAVPALGRTATYFPATFTLSYVKDGKTISLELIPAQKLTPTAQARVEQILVTIAQH